MLGVLDKSSANIGAVNLLGRFDAAQISGNLKSYVCPDDDRNNGVPFGLSYRINTGYAKATVFDAATVPSTQFDANRLHLGNASSGTGGVSISSQSS